MRIGITLPVGATDGPGGALPRWSFVTEMAAAAEASGLDAVWVADHFFYRTPDGETHGIHEAWTLLSAVAAVTSRVTVGTLVSCTAFRSAGLLAKMATTLDEVSGGRLVLGVGAGWHDPEFEAFGYPADHKVTRFAERLEATVRLLRGETVTMDGGYERLREAVLVPPPAREIPILVAAEAPKMFALTARWADAWVTAWYGAPSVLVELQLRGLERALDDAGRARSAVRRMVGVTVRDPEQPPVAEPEEDALAGSPEEVAEAFRAYGRLGMDELIVSLEPMTPRSVERLVAARRLLVRSGSR